ncbi:hypothetical protein [Roseibium sp.]|uniref:hypothetical protein n=1 Tax=Roseibium sp. TaxID=1936156 RepID=UPI00326799E8
MAQDTKDTGKNPKSDDVSKQDRKHQEDLLDEALDESFPASDPPAMVEPTPHAKPKDA